MLLALACIIALGAGCQWLAWRLGLPSILVLLFAGVLAGPVARALTPSLLGHPISIDPEQLMPGRTLLDLVSLAVGLILFEGGLTLNAREITGVRRVVMMLITAGAAITWTLAAIAAHFLLGLSWPLSLLFGAVLVVTGPTVIGPLLRFVRPTGRAGSILRWEGIVIDPIGAMLAVLVFEVVISGLGGSSDNSMLLAAWSIAQRVVLTVSVGTVVGLLAALLLVHALASYAIPDHLQVPITLAAAVVAFTGSNHLAHESGLFATTIMGIAMANQRRAGIRHILDFKEVMATLLIAVLFIVLSARMNLANLRAIGPGVIAFLAALVLLIRPLSVLVSTMGSTLSLRERLFIGWLAPRGIVAASVASVFALRLQEQAPAAFADARLLVPYTFLVVVFTVTTYGLAAAPIARRLGLSHARHSGFLIVGGDAFGQELAAALAAEGVDVLVVDTNFQNVRDARLRGLPVMAASALSPEVTDRIALSPIGRLIAITSNHEVNTLASLQYARLFGRNNVFQLAEKRRSAPPADHRADEEMVGRTLFAPDADIDLIEQWLELGARIRKTRLTEAFNLNAYLQQNAGRAIPLFVVSDAGATPVLAREPIRARPGDHIIGLALPQDESPNPQPEARSPKPASPDP